MVERTTARRTRAADSNGEAGPFELDAAQGADDYHVRRRGIVCGSEARGLRTPRNLQPSELVLDASEGFVPMWGPAVTLRWRFQDRSFSAFRNPLAAKEGVRKLLTDAMLAWGDAAPVKLKEQYDAYDFEVRVRRADECSDSGCVLAEAFFPDSGRHLLTIYPKMFEQTPKEQVETMAHELGHVFGLRHWFASISESNWASVVYGTHSQYSIMNYGAKSRLTAADKRDLKKLYQQVWSGKLTNINSTPIRLVRPWHETGELVTLRA